MSAPPRARAHPARSRQRPVRLSGHVHNFLRRRAGAGSGQGAGEGTFEPAGVGGFPGPPRAQGCPSPEPRLGGCSCARERGLPPLQLRRARGSHWDHLFPALPAPRSPQPRPRLPRCSCRPRSDRSRRAAAAEPAPHTRAQPPGSLRRRPRRRRRSGFHCDSVRRPASCRPPATPAGHAHARAPRPLPPPPRRRGAEGRASGGGAEAERGRERSPAPSPALPERPASRASPIPPAPMVQRRGAGEGGGGDRSEGIGCIRGIPVGPRSPIGYCPVFAGPRATETTPQSAREARVGGPRKRAGDSAALEGCARRWVTSLAPQCQSGVVTELAARALAAARASQR